MHPGWADTPGLGTALPASAAPSGLCSGRRRKGGHDRWLAAAPGASEPAACSSSTGDRGRNTAWAGHAVPTRPARRRDSGGSVLSDGSVHGRRADEPPDPAARASSAARRAAVDRVAPVVEDSLEIACDQDPMCDRSERPVRHPVENGVTNRATSGRSRSHACVPRAERALRLRVDEPPSWLPLDDLGAPADRDPVGGEHVLDRRSLPHRDRSWREERGSRATAASALRGCRRRRRTRTPPRRQGDELGALDAARRLRHGRRSCSAFPRRSTSGRGRGRTSRRCRAGRSGGRSPSGGSCWPSSFSSTSNCSHARPGSFISARSRSSGPARYASTRQKSSADPTVGVSGSRRPRRAPTPPGQVDEAAQPPEPVAEVPARLAADPADRTKRLRREGPALGSSGSRRRRLPCRTPP